MKRLIISLFIFSNFLSSQIISINPDSLYQYVMPGDSATQQLAISNSSGDDLIFYFDTTTTIAKADTATVTVEYFAVEIDTNA